MDSTPSSPTALPKLAPRVSISSTIPISKDIQKRATKRLKKQRQPKRYSVSLLDKFDILQYQEDNSQASPQEINQALSLKINITTISKILKYKDAIIAWTNGMKKVDLESKTKLSSGHFPSLDSVLLEWFAGTRAQGAPINAELLAAKARELRDLTVEELKEWGAVKEAERAASFRASVGYVEFCKQSHNLAHIYVCGKAGSVDKQQLTIEREKLFELLAQYSFADVYNLDETALFFNMLPSQTIGSPDEKGAKKPKDRDTVVLVVTADGTDKVKPIIIGELQYSIPSLLTYSTTDSNELTLQNNVFCYRKGHATKMSRSSQEPQVSAM